MADFPYDRDVDEAAAKAHVSRTDPDLGARRCKSCRRAILWTVTESGARMPVDFAPTVDGTVAIAHEVVDGRRVWRSRIAQLGESVVRRKAHWATCPSAAQHRKPKR